MKFKVLVFITASTLILSCHTFAQEMMQQKKQYQKQVHQQLNLTEEQQTKVDELKFAHNKEMIDLKANLEKEELDMTELKSNVELHKSEARLALPTRHNVVRLPVEEIGQQDCSES